MSGPFELRASGLSSPRIRHGVVKTKTTTMAQQRRHSTEIVEKEDEDEEKMKVSESFNVNACTGAALPQFPLGRAGRTNVVSLWFPFLVGDDDDDTSHHLRHFPPPLRVSARHVDVYYRDSPPKPYNHPGPSTSRHPSRAFSTDNRCVYRHFYASVCWVSINDDLETLPPSTRTTAVKAVKEELDELFPLPKRVRTRPTSSTINHSGHFVIVSERARAARLANACPALQHVDFTNGGQWRRPSPALPPLPRSRSSPCLPFEDLSVKKINREVVTPRLPRKVLPLTEQ
ncbi:hypothetical protein IW261DRAFT_1425083 [Armillaria novae-zelandiae]|uniref:Uncharacterized protein n=1 Tax=Armillaria novae-zelandiae TaxID=153914 RepID=A0AA39NU01_9AGAR|nr:hypothetical protein IW261DRAFT_1425083 [Armillaria novae-zelandiae]